MTMLGDPVTIAAQLGLNCLPLAQKAYTKELMYKVVAVGVFAIITHAYMINLIYIEVCQSWNEWLKTEVGCGTVAPA